MIESADCHFFRKGHRSLFHLVQNVHIAEHMQHICYKFLIEAEVLNADYLLLQYDLGF